MRITPLQRYHIYRFMAAEVKENLKIHHNTLDGVYRFGCGYCAMLFRSLALPESELENLTELWAKKPKQPYNFAYWFAPSKNGWKKRLELLEECIRETEHFFKP